MAPEVTIKFSHPCGCFVLVLEFPTWKSTGTSQQNLLLDPAPHTHSCFTSEIPTRCSLSTSKRCKGGHNCLSHLNPLRFSLQLLSNAFISSARVSELILRDQTRMTAYHRGIFWCQQMRELRGQTKDKLWSHIWETELQIKVVSGT